MELSISIILLLIVILGFDVYILKLIQIKSYGLFLKTFFFTFSLTELLFLLLPYIVNNAAMFEFVNPIDEDWYMGAFFDDRNKHTSYSSDSSHIFILNVQDSVFTRKNIAKVLQKLREIKPNPPAIVGIDIPFTDPYSDQESDSLLISALRGLIDDSVKVVYAVTQDKNSNINHPFFKDSIEGAYMGLTTHNNLDLLNYECYLNGAPLFSTKIAELTIGESLSNNNMIINFRNKKVFDGHPSISYLDEIESVSSMVDLSGEIVLIGNEEDPTDQKYLPFVTDSNNIKQIAGIDLIAYEICTLKAKLKGYNKQWYYPYKVLPPLWFVLLLNAFWLIYFLILYLLSYIDNIHSHLLTTILEPICLIGVEILMFIVCGFVTESFMYIPNFAFLLSFIALMGFVYKFSNNINISSTLSSTWKRFLRFFRLFLSWVIQFK